VPDGGRVLTIPNALSVGRLLCAPVFVYLLFGAHQRYAAAWLLAALGLTDWVDGYVARRFGQVSELGKILDPTADRILLGTAMIAILIDGSVPVWVAAAAITREALVSIAAIALAALGARRIDVQWVGKAGTFAMMFAFPFFLASHAAISWRDEAWVLAWLFAIPGLLLSWYAAATYIPLARHALRDAVRLVGLCLEQLRAEVGCGFLGQMRRQHHALAKRRQPRVGVDQTVFGRARAVPDRHDAQHLGQILADRLGAQLVEVELLDEARRKRPRAIEEEAAAVRGRCLGDDAIDNDLALRRQQRAEPRLLGRDLGDVRRQEPVEKGARVGACDLDHAAVGEKCRFHAIPCCLRERMPLMLAAQGLGIGGVRWRAATT